MNQSELRQIAKRYFTEYASFLEEEDKMNEQIKKVNDANRHSDIDEKKEKEIREKGATAKKRSAIKRKYEKKKHKLFVKECLSPKGYKDNKGEVFALFLPQSFSDENSMGDSEYIEYHISLVTPSMAYTDYVFFAEKNDNKPWWDEEYRPYYYDLRIYVHKDDDKWREFYNKHREGDWIRAKIVSTTDKIGDIKQVGIIRFGGSDIFTEEVVIDFERQKEIDANLVTDDRKKTIEELRELYEDKLKSIRTIKTSDYLNKKIVSIKDYTIDVLNVGQANCIHVKADDKFSFMFDVGIPFEEYKDRSGVTIPNEDYTASTGINKSIGILARYKPDFVLISHWHADHVNGYVHMCNDGLNCHWIVPQLDDRVKDVTCVRLALYLAERGVLSVITGGFNSSLYKKYGIELFRGEGNGNLNDGSIMMRISHALLAADCMYRHWPDSLKGNVRDITHLVVPHHGSKVGPEDKKVLEKFKGKKRTAIVCVGNNGYSHPDDSHFDELIKNDLDSIYITGGAKRIEYHGTDINSHPCFKSSNRGVKFTL